jgi:aspartate racemase
MKEKAVGIIGGMGPEATVDLMARIIRATPALDDRDHIRVVVDNNPKVPSRIQALIQGTGESAAPCLIEMARKLAAWGVDFLAMPCNTAHYYHQAIQDAVDIPLLNMIDLAVEAVQTDHPGIQRLGLLASTAVLNLGLYKKRLAQQGVEVLHPVPSLQERLMQAIRQIKTSHYGHETVDALQAAAIDLTERGAGILLVACTELSIIASSIRTSAAVYDSAQILAEAIVKTAKAE